MPEIRILFLSDLHATSTPPKQGVSSPSFLEPYKLPRDRSNDPFEALKYLIHEQDIEVDLVVCAGDLCDKADPGGIAHAWSELHAVGKLAKAKHTIAVSGNHDLDSRFQSNTEDPDPKGVLQELTPRFPLGEPHLFDRYWSQNFTTLDLPELSGRVLLVNSSAYHGGLQDELNHGRVTHRTIKRIRETLESEGARELNICVCHHHPFPNAQLSGTADYEAIRNGQALIDLLDGEHHGPWMMLHGHRHFARLGYAAGSSAPPLVIGAATFAARISDAANQVHIIRAESPKDSSYHIRGTIQSWTFSYSNGFVMNSTNNNALPGMCSFGYRGSMRGLAKQVSDFVSGKTVGYIEWSEIEDQLEHVRYLTPPQLIELITALKRQNIKVLPGEYSRPSQVMMVSK